jgi:hypothetical protein
LFISSLLYDTHLREKKEEFRINESMPCIAMDRIREEK